MSFEMEPTMVMASIFAGIAVWFVTSAIIKYQEKVFNYLFKASGVSMVLVAGCIIYDITIDLSDVINYAATLVHSFSIGNTWIAMFSFLACIAIALFTGVYKK